MKRIILFLLLLIPSLVFATEELDITVSGSGIDKEAAIKDALRSALEQTYGAFVSTSTKIQNDKLMSDEIVSLSRGNIKNYNILSENQLTNGHWYVLLHATVNINQLAKYVKGGGATVEVDMNAFNAKVLLEEMNAKAERRIIENLIAEIESIELWNYTLELDEPAVSDDKYLISGIIKVKCNANTIMAVKLITDVFSELDIDNHPENKVKGRDYYHYISNYFPQGVTLRNVYSNGLLHYSRSFYGDLPGWIVPVINYDPRKSTATFLNKIRFAIDPLKITIDGKNTWIVWDHNSNPRYNKSNCHSGGYLKLISEEVENTYYNPKKRVQHNIGDVIFNIHFEKEVSREEALKIKKVTVRPIKG